MGNNRVIFSVLKNAISWAFFFLIKNKKSIYGKNPFHFESWKKESFKLEVFNDIVILAV